MSLVNNYETMLIYLVSIGSRNMNFNDDYLCPLCISRHPLRKCRRFLAMPPAEKMALVKAKSACENCLAFSHQLSKCTSRAGCWTCWGTHHTLLHPHLIEEKSAWIQMTACAIMWCRRDPQQHHRVRIIIDPSVVSSYNTPTDTFPLAWEKCTDILNVCLWGLRDDVRTVTVDLVRRVQRALVAPGSHLVSGPIKHRYRGSVLADAAFHIPYPSTIDLGSDVAGAVYMRQPEKQGDLPYAQKTIFGLGFFGRVDIDPEYDDESY